MNKVTKNNHPYRYLKNEKGFTFVELIITVVIIGIIATAAAMRFIDLSQSADAGACRTNQLALQTAQIFYYADQIQTGNGHYAESLDRLAPYLKNEEIPTCPGNGTYLLLSGGEVICSVREHHR